MGQPFPEEIADGGNNLLVPAIQSPNFSITNQTGWAIEQNGDAYFYNITAEGSVTATTLVATGPGEGVFVQGSDNQSIDIEVVNSAPYIFWDTGQSGVEYQAQIYANELPATGAQVFNISGPVLESPYNDQVFIQLLSGVSGNSAALIVQYQNTSGSDFVPIRITSSGMQLMYATITASEPGNPLVSEGWHAMDLDLGWSTASGYPVPSYRLLPDGNVQIAGYATHESFSSGTALLGGGLPSAYCPATTQFVPGWGGGGSSLEIATNGLITAYPNSSSASSVAFAQIYPVNL